MLGVLLFIRLIKKLLDNYRGACVYSIIGMMLGSYYAIVIGPTQLKVPRHAMAFSDFSVIFFVIGVAVMLLFTALKGYEEKKRKNAAKEN